MKKKKSMEEAQPVDSLSLSFLDVLSCGLAAMLVLFFVFSMLPHGKEAMTANAKGSGADRKTSQSGVRAKGMFARPNQSPFGLNVVMIPGKDGESVVLTPDDVEWRCRLGVDWVGLIGSAEPNVELNVDESNRKPPEGRVAIRGFTQNSPRNFKKVTLWVNSEKLRSYEGAKVELLGTVDDNLEYQLDFNKSDANPSLENGKTLVLTADRSRKNDWLDSVFKLEARTEAPEVPKSPDNNAHPQ